MHHRALKPPIKIILIFSLHRKADLLTISSGFCSSPETDIFLAHKQRQEENEAYLHEQLATYFDWEVTARSPDFLDFAN